MMYITVHLNYRTVVTVHAKYIAVELSLYPFLKYFIAKKKLIDVHCVSNNNKSKLKLQTYRYRNKHNNLFPYMVQIRLVTFTITIRNLL